MLPLGFQLTDEELPKVGLTMASLAQVTPIMAIQSGRCQRCQQRALAPLPDGRQYCTACVGLGRVTTTTKLWRLPSGPGNPSAMTWRGTLTPAQKQAAQAALTAVSQGRDFLLWAVTGAGKTEMLFPVVAAYLARGKRVAIASPRVDVVRELAPRLAQAFAQASLSVLYGGSAWPEVPADLTVTTTHQLLRYYRHFDLVVVDEVDAFPYTQTPILAAAVQQARRGPTIFLSATPDKTMQQAVKRQQLAVAFLPRRFHGAPLPVPRLRLTALKQGPKQLGKRDLALLQDLAADRRVLVFVPRIAWLKPLARRLEQAGLAVRTAHAADPDRAAVVQAFRQGKFTVLLTTTILERGVTIPRCAVVVVAADDPQFSASGLIQMAGRAGRSAASPDDPVWFLARHVTLAQIEAIHAIRQMNRRQP